jgi:hypothetical protein
LLKAHLDATEQHLLAISQIPANAGHMLHRGTPREAFVKEFLVGHLSDRLAVGSGEIIDAKSLPREPRNQFDIVIYRADYPKIYLGGGINAFLAESVVATIEIKSLLTEDELDVAINNANKIKQLERHLVTSITSGYVPPGILSYVIAYSGPANILTVYNWLSRCEARRDLNQQLLPSNHSDRQRILSESVEGIFCLGLGSIIFDNSPLSVISDEMRQAHPTQKRIVISNNSGNLLWLFLLLTFAGANVLGQWANLVPYLQRYPIESTFSA